jgi:hypothetical protein
MRRRTFLRLAAVAAVGFVMTTHLATARECTVPPELMEVSARLPHVAARLRARKPVRIVVIGGGSTRGAAAGAAEFSYPSRLQRALAAMFPSVPVTVLNKGVPRQSAEQMLARFPSDVFAENPVLVVWETGISDAVRGTERDAFAAALQSGIDLAKNRAIDIVLVDMQFSRKAAMVIDFERYLDTIHQIGEINDVYVFPRFAMMRHWSERSLFNFDEVAVKERAGLAAAVYDCLAKQLALAIRTAAT